MEYLKAFLVGGLFCVVGQILIDKTKLTPARILVAYVVAGVILGAVGVYKPLAEWAGAGATVPLTGFGFSGQGRPGGGGREGPAGCPHRGRGLRRRGNHRRHLLRGRGGPDLQTQTQRVM